MASRNPSGSGEGLNKGAWTETEDNILNDYIKANGVGKWSLIPIKAGLNRCGKSCRLRWLNYLRPDIKRGNISEDEEELIIRLHKLLGNRWSLIAGRLPGRTDNEIKNYWNTIARKKVMGQASSRRALSKLLKSRRRRSCMNGTTDKKEAMASIVHCRNSIDSKEQGRDERLKPEPITPGTKWTVDKDCTFEDFELDDRLLLDFLGLNDNIIEHKEVTNESVQHMTWDTEKVSPAAPSLKSNDDLIISWDCTLGESDLQTSTAPLLGEGELDQLLYEHYSIS